MNNKQHKAQTIGPGASDLHFAEGEDGVQSGVVTTLGSLRELNVGVCSHSTDWSHLAKIIVWFTDNLKTIPRN